MGLMMVVLIAQMALIDTFASDVLFSFTGRLHVWRGVLWHRVGRRRVEDILRKRVFGLSCSARRVRGGGDAFGRERWVKVSIVGGHSTGRCR